MGDGEPCSEHGAIAAVESEQRVGRPVRQQPRHPPAQSRAGPGGAEPLAFEAQISNLVERIDDTQPRVEFKAVDDADPAS